MTPVLVIGSCRVHRPVAGQDKKRMHYLTGGVGAYTHTAKEAVQRLEALRGDHAVAPHLAKYVYATGGVPADASCRPEELRRSEVLVVEVSSEKEVVVDDVYLQLNYLASTLIAPLGKEGKAWWSQLLRHGEPDARTVAAVLATPAAASLSNGDRYVLHSARLQRSTRASLRQDMIRLMQLSGRPVLIVTHVDLGQMEPGALEGRSRFVACVKQAAEGLPGISVFDPTPVVAAFGKQFALNDDGGDVNHYAAAFEPILGRLLATKVDALSRAPKTISMEIAA